MQVSQAREILDLARRVEARALEDDADVWIDRLDARASDIEPAAETLLAAGDREAALELAGALRLFWQDSGRVDEGRNFTEGLLARTDASPPSPHLAKAHLALGELAFRQGDQDVAGGASKSARRLGRELDDDWIVGRSELNLARVAFRDGDTERIFKHANRVLDAAGDDARLRSGATHMLAWAEYTAGDLTAAIVHFEKNVNLYRSIGDRIGEASELANLGDLALETGDVTKAKEYFGRTFRVPRIAENRYLGLSLIRSIGALLALDGHHQAGLELIAASERLYEDSGLVPDPGDEVTPRARDGAVLYLGSDAPLVEARGRGLTFEQAISLVREFL